MTWKEDCAAIIASVTKDLPPACRCSMRSKGAEMLKWLRELWCELAHAGGRVQRDPAGRINWQCSTCGRWSVPVPLEDERRAVERDIVSSRLLLSQDRRR